MIVYIDDEPVLCRIFTRILTAAGIRVRAFTNPAEALAFVADNATAAIVCDYRMPEMTGLQVLGHLDRELPFYLVSGDIGIADEVAADPRVTGVLTKPFRAERLLELLAPYRA
ncbi:MAG: response regulator [Alphaproteobacteria bacterium]|nr:response regulator [Alphaproteobacteria bacterium]